MQDITNMNGTEPRQSCSIDRPCLGFPCLRAKRDTGCGTLVKYHILSAGTTAAEANEVGNA